MKVKIKKSIYISWFFFLWGISWPDYLHAQPLQSMRFEVLDEQQGLSNHWITDLAYDSSGFAWIGTRGGLNRYDGYRFKVFKHNPGDKYSLPVDDGQKLYTDSKGKLWVSHANGDIRRFDEKCQCFYPVLKGQDIFPGLNDAQFGVKYIDEQGSIWFSGDGLGLNIFDTDKRKILHYNLPWITREFSKTDNIRNNTIHSVYQHRAGQYWLATQHGLYYFEPSKGILSLRHYPDVEPKIKEKASFHKILPDGDKGLWLATFEVGLHYYEFHTGKFTHYLFETHKTGYYNLLYDLKVKDEDELWLTSGDRGLGVFNTITKKSEFNQRLLNNRDGNIMFLEDILILPSGTILLEDENAVLKYNPIANIFQFNPLEISESQHGHLFSISKILEQPELNRIYFATEHGNGLNILNTTTHQLKAYNIETNPLRDYKKRIKNMVFDSQKRLWLISRDYLYLYDPESDRLVRIPEPFPQGVESDVEFVQMWNHPDGSIFVLTQSGSIYPLEIENRRFKTALKFQYQKKSTNAPVKKVVSDSKGDLWVNLGNEFGVARLDAGQWNFVPWSFYKNSGSPKIRGLTADKLGNVWINVYGKGLFKLSLSVDGLIESKSYGVQEGLPDLTSYAIGADPHNGIWVSTLSGVAYLAQGKDHFQLFNQSVGMDKFTVSLRFMQSGNNAFYITVPGKYCKVDFESIRKISMLPVMYIDALKVYDHSRLEWFSKNVEAQIYPGEDYFSFEFSCIDFVDQSHHQFWYQLEGWDHEWINAGNRRFAGYTNLGEGKYLFKVKVANSEGQWSETRKVPVNIQTHIYKKKWFEFLLAVVVSALIFVFYLFRIKRIRKSEKLKTEMNRQLAESRMEALRAQMNPHFIFNSLNSINRYIIKNDAKTSSLYLTRFSKLMRLVLDNSKHKTITLSAELEALKLYIELEVFRFDQKFEFSIDVEDNVQTDFIEVPPLIIQPFVENAIWHGLLHKDGPGKLQITLKISEGFLVICVTDNGVGRKKAMELKGVSNQTRQSHGLKLTDERIQSINDSNQNRVEIEDLYDSAGVPAGTAVTIYIELSNDYD